MLNDEQFAELRQVVIDELKRQKWWIGETFGDWRDNRLIDIEGDLDVRLFLDRVVTAYEERIRG